MRREVLGFWLVGAGRSDVMKALFGLVSYHGTVLIDGKEVRIANPKQAIDHGIAFVTENRKEEGLDADARRQYEHAPCGVSI